MAISEITKQINSEVKQQLNAQIGKLVSEKAEHVAAIDVINTQLAALRARKDALVTDIAEPSLVVEGA
jgi:hypothetical protein